MVQPTQKELLSTLRAIQAPGRDEDIVSAGMVTGLVVKDGTAGFALDIGDADPARMEPLRQACEAALLGLSGITKAHVVLTAERQAAPSPSKGPDATPPPRPRAIPGIKAIIAVASGKGGVGKSTVAANLAVSMAKMGKKIGLLDADIYGPSVPMLLNLKGRPHSDGKKIEPKLAFGVKAMSIGLMIDVDTPMIWRGPMVTSALRQLLSDVDWGELDVLLVDMPPGTGDIALTMVQQVPLAGAVVVSTPQDLALIDARKAIAMFAKVDVPVLGIIENMSGFACPHCGEVSHIFGHEGAKALAEKLRVEFLGGIPLHLTIRESSDSGQPVAEFNLDSAPSQAFTAAAKRITDKISAFTLP